MNAGYIESFPVNGWAELNPIGQFNDLVISLAEVFAGCAIMPIYPLFVSRYINCTTLVKGVFYSNA